ncbi:hypothetical protein WN944_025892 [Citrus x changshan-huyou]|uniref:Uncharacterized protein n=1 Tax=Citrus x changshan-huyou TaxID=2935761 RepID=A0AAP0LR52_9ROSI
METKLQLEREGRRRPGKAPDGVRGKTEREGERSERKLGLELS